MSRRHSATAFAPASIGNVGVGFDMLGLAIAGPGDRVTVTRSGNPRHSISSISYEADAKHTSLATDVAKNTASISAQALWAEHGDGGGLEFSIHKGIPLSSGMGSSAASAVAGVVATNALLEKPLAIAALLPFALVGERFASGGDHADNVAPSLLGGLVFCPMNLLPALTHLPAPDNLRSVLVHPELRVNTATARLGLGKTVTLADWIAQQSFLGGFIAGCATGNEDLIRHSVQDIIIEPQRCAAVAGFTAIKEAALHADAFGCSLSGSGPSIFALCTSDAADAVAAAMTDACQHECQVWISKLNAPGASLLAD